MISLSEKNPEFKLKTTIDEFEIELQISGIDRIEEGYLSLMKARKKIVETKQKYKLLMIADKCGEEAIQHWDVSENKRILIGIDEKANGIMLSLLSSYPECRRVSDIISDTKYAQATVSRYFSGSLGNKECVSRNVKTVGN